MKTTNQWVLQLDGMISMHLVPEIVQMYRQQIVSKYRILDSIYQQLSIQSM